MRNPNFAKDKLRSLVARVERLEAEKQALSDDIREVYKEAKGHGFDVKIMRKAVSRRKVDQAKQQEQDALLELYMAALEVSATVVQMRTMSNGNAASVAAE